MNAAPKIPMDCSHGGTEHNGAKVVGLGGGIGASRVWRPLSDACGPDRFTAIVNVAEDLWVQGLRVCPDIDTVLYSLSGRYDLARGWGVRGDSFRCMEALRALGEDAWFNLGDLDLATHLLRTQWLRAGDGLAEITARLGKAMQVSACVLPVSENEIRTLVRIQGGQEIGYVDYLVRRRAEDFVVSTRWEGIEQSRPAAGVLDVIAQADLIVLGPSNPVASMEPILRVPGVAEAVKSSRAFVVGISPTVAALAISDEGERRRAHSREALLKASGTGASASAVAGLYADLLDAFVVDHADIPIEATKVAALGLEVIGAHTLLHLDPPAFDLIPELMRRATAKSSTRSPALVT